MRDPITKRSNDWESSLWFYKNFDPLDKRQRGETMFSSYLLLRLAEGDTLSFFKL